MAMKTLEELGVSKGEWRYDPRDNCTIRVFGGNYLAQLCLTPRRDADGALMAASKPMYEALLAAELDVAQLCEGQDPANECWNTLAKIRAAIAAAGGA